MKTKRGLPEMTWIADRELWRKRGTYKGHKYNITAKEPEDVMAKIEAFKAEIDSGIIDESLTVFQYIQRWYPTKVAGLKPKSAEVYKNCIDNHVIPKLGNLLVKDVKPLHIDGLMAGLEGKSSSLNSKVLNTLRQIFDSAVENDVIRKNPCMGRKAGGERTRPKTPLTHEQQDQLTAAVLGTRAELFTLLCLYAGLRREEALGLLWSSVFLDAAAPYIDVRHTVTFNNNRPIHAETLKSRAARRSIPIPPILTEALRAAKKSAKSVLVVPSVREGGAMSEIAFRRMWEFATRSVDFHIEPHLLRHTYITELCSSGMDIKKIQYLAGHATVQMTLNIYTHVTRNKPEQLAPDINKTFSRTPARTLGVDLRDAHSDKASNE